MHQVWCIYQIIFVYGRVFASPAPSTRPQVAGFCPEECILMEEEIPLSRTGFGRPFIASAILLSALSAFAQQPATTPPGPVPSAIPAAKTIFLSNPGTVRGLYTGEPNRAYEQFYVALQSTGLFQLAGDPADADLVLQLQVIDAGPGASTFKLLIYDRKTHFLLWTLLEPIKACNRPKTCDSNFDDALPALLLNFEKLAGKTPGALH
jgi:hypothetical protein